MAQRPLTFSSQHCESLPEGFCLNTLFGKGNQVAVGRSMYEGIKSTGILREQLEMATDKR